MAENDDQERTEQPSEKRLREAREKGDIPRSRDLSGALVTLAGVAALLSGSERAMSHARTIYHLGLESFPDNSLFRQNIRYCEQRLQGK